MDSTEDDTYARVLLRGILHTVMKISCNQKCNKYTSEHEAEKHPGLESTGSALQHKLKKKLHESASLSSLPSPKRQRSTVPKTYPTGTVPSPVYDDEDMTPRGLLRGIIQMENKASLLMSGQPALQESELNPADTVELCLDWSCLI